MNRRVGEVERLGQQQEQFEAEQERLTTRAETTAEIAREKNRIAQAKIKAAEAEPGKTDLLMDIDRNLHRWPQGEPIPAGWQKAPVTTTKLAQAKEGRLGERAEFLTAEGIAKNISIVEKNLDDPAAAGFMEIVNRARPESNEFYIQTQPPPVKVPADVPLFGGKDVFQRGVTGQKVQLPTGVTSADIYTTAEENDMTPEEVLKRLGVLE